MGIELKEEEDAASREKQLNNLCTTLIISFQTPTSLGGYSKVNMG